ncbi:MAG TPA: ribose-phosphate diphosphokinase [Actinomycetota bacterium]|nr:ribose-phosphate diphosphokinase [Actinomycetota bacterium]
MELLVRKQLVLYSGSSHPELAEDVSKLLDVNLGDVDIHRFLNGEIYVRFLESVRGSDVFVIQTHVTPVNEHIMETLVMLDALKRASAARITIVLPFYPYSRMDQKTLAREPISAKLMADLLHTAGADRVISTDLHAGQIQAFFNFPFDHLTTRPLLVDYLAKEIGGDMMLVSPDAGRAKLVDKFANALGAPLAILHKRRDPNRHNVSETLDVVGDVQGRRCVLVDDIIETAGTLCDAARVLAEHGAAEVYAVATHAVLSGPAVDRLRNSVIKKVVVTNSLPIAPEKRFEKLDVVSIAPVIADAIRAVFEDESVSSIFGGDNA